MQAGGSHDLQFSVQNADGSFVQQQPPMQPGAMAHLPDQAGTTTNTATVGSYVQDKLAQSSHPTVLIFHLLFKGIGLFLYLFGNWFVGDEDGQFVSLMVVCILILAADFWVVKNVTGRLLVGLRWWNRVDDNGTTWVFESAAEQAAARNKPPPPINAFDRSVFWTVLYATPMVWAFLFVWGIIRIKLKWLTVVGLALSLSCANVYGYYKCSSDQKARFQQMVQEGAQQGAIAVMRTNMLSVLTGQASGGTTAAPASNTFV